MKTKIMKKFFVITIILVCVFLPGCSSNKPSYFQGYVSPGQFLAWISRLELFKKSASQSSGISETFEKIQEALEKPATAEPAVTMPPEPPTAEPLIEPTKVVEERVPTRMPGEAPGIPLFDSSTPLLEFIDTGKPVNIQVYSFYIEDMNSYMDQFPQKGNLINLVPYEYEQLETTIKSYYEAGLGFADAILLSVSMMNEISSLGNAYDIDFRQFIPGNILNKFNPGVLRICWDGEKLTCLPREQTHVVLWYNLAKVEDLGISVPETYEGLLETCTKLKRTHPQVRCLVGDPRLTWFNLLVSSQCPFQQVLTPKIVRINLNHENCVKAAKYFDNLKGNGNIALSRLWDSENLNLLSSGNWLFLPGPSLLGNYLFQDSVYHETDIASHGVLDIAPMFKWSGQDHPWVFWWGSLNWLMYQHSQNKGLAIDFILHDIMKNGETNDIYPAYEPAISEWVKNRLTEMYFLNDQTQADQVLRQESAHMWSMVAEEPVDIYQTWDAFQDRITTGALTYQQAIVEWQKAMVAEAYRLGFQVVTDGIDY